METKGAPGNLPASPLPEPHPEKWKTPKEKGLGRSQHRFQMERTEKRRRPKDASQQLHFCKKKAWKVPGNSIRESFDVLVANTGRYLELITSLEAPIK